MRCENRHVSYDIITSLIVYCSLEKNHKTYAHRKVVIVYMELPCSVMEYLLATIAFSYFLLKKKFLFYDVSRLIEDVVNE